MYIPSESEHQFDVRDIKELEEVKKSNDLTVIVIRDHKIFKVFVKGRDFEEFDFKEDRIRVGDIIMTERSKV